MGKKKKLNIVIASDNVNDLEIIKQAFSKVIFSYEYSCVYNGLQLIDFLTGTNSYKNTRSESPDLLLVDLGMKFMNGVGVLHMISKDPYLSRIPVYVLSDSSTIKYSSESLELGIRGFYKKPKAIDGFLRIVEEIVDRNSFSTYIEGN